MPVRFRCPECNQLMSISTRMVGQTVRCPGCEQDIVVPAEDELTAAPLETEPATEDADASGENLLPAGETASHPDSPTEPQRHTASGAATGSSPAQDESDDADAFGLAIRRPATEFEDMDLTPMVDVTFLLLIFFMVTASFSLHKTIEVPTPDPEEQGATQSIQKIEDLLDDSIKVEVDERDAITIDDEPLSNPEDLAETLRSKMRSDQKVEMVLRASDNARHEMIVTVVDAGNAVGMQRIRMVVTPAQE